MKIELTDQQLNNLFVFLQRVQLNGTEAAAYMEIVNTLQEQTKQVNFPLKEAER